MLFIENIGDPLGGNNSNHFNGGSGIRKTRVLSTPTFENSDKSNRTKLAHAEVRGKKEQAYQPWASCIRVVQICGGTPSKDENTGPSQSEHQPWSNNNSLGSSRLTESICTGYTTFPASPTSGFLLPHLRPCPPPPLNDCPSPSPCTLTSRSLWPSTKEVSLVYIPFYSWGWHKDNDLHFLCIIINCICNVAFLHSTVTIWITKHNIQ